MPVAADEQVTYLELSEDAGSAHKFYEVRIMRRGRDGQVRADR